MKDGREAAEAEGHEERERASLGELFGKLAHDGATLVRQEIELAKTELGESARRAALGAGWVAAGGAIILIGLLVLIAALVVGLGDLLGSYWLSALLVGLAFVAVGAVVALAALKRLKRADLRPAATMQTMEHDKRWARAELQQLKRDFTRSPE
jgi:hypothetical protein